jgi:hypothetical protein
MAQPRSPRLQTAAEAAQLVLEYASVIAFVLQPQLEELIEAACAAPGWVTFSVAAALSRAAR